MIPHRSPALLRRLAWATPVLWFVALLLLIPSFEHAAQPPVAVPLLLLSGVLAALIGLLTCSRDYRTTNPREHAQLVQGAMWLATAWWVAQRMKD